METNKKPRIRIVCKSKTGVTLDYKGDIGKVTSTWEDFNETYDIVDEVWAVPKDEAWKKIQEKQEEFNKVVEKAVLYAIITDNSEDPRKKLEAMAALGSCTDEAMKVLECSREDALRMLQKALSSYGKSYRELKEARREPKTKPATYTFGDVPGFDKI